MRVLCVLPLIAAFAAYIVAGMRISYRMTKEGKDGHEPRFLAAFLPGSYTAEGRRLLGRLWILIVALPFFLIGLLLASIVVCNVVSWIVPTWG